MPRYQAMRNLGFPIGSSHGHGVWDFKNRGFIHVDGREWVAWDEAVAVRAAAELNEGKVPECFSV